MRYRLLTGPIPLCRAAAFVVAFLGAVLNPSYALASMLTVWDPGEVNILNQFGTRAEVADDFSTCCHFAGLNAVAETVAQTPLPGHPPLNANIFARAEATAIVGEFSVGALTSNQTGPGGSARDISALAAATTTYYIPALGGDSELVRMNLSVEGSFDSDSAGSFVAIEILVNDMNWLAVGINHGSNGSSTLVSDLGLPNVNLGPWTGSRRFDFFLPADPDEDTFGTLALNLWMFSNSRGQEGSNGNAADFLNTATLTAEPPPGGFVGFATGMAFVPDAEAAVPAPGSLALFVLGLAGLVARAPGRIARR